MTATPRDQVIALLADFAFDPMGNVDGLTTHEFRRAWWARHHTDAPVRLLHRMSEHGEVRDTRRRPCAVTHRRLVAWVPGNVSN